MFLGRFNKIEPKSIWPVFIVPEFLHLGISMDADKQFSSASQHVQKTLKAILMIKITHRV